MRADLDKNPYDMKSIFNAVTERHDLMNFLASLGQEKFWRQVARRAVATRPGIRVLNVAAGTGVSTIEFVRAGAEVITVGFSQGMIHKGRVRHLELDFQQADAMNLKFADNSFGAVTISLRLRNITDPDQASREFCRVLCPGGHLVVYEFSRPAWAPFRALYRFFLGTIPPPITRLASSDAVTYDYLAESILAWPSQYQFAMHLHDAGFEHL